MQFGILVLVLAARMTTQAQNNFKWKDGSGETRNLSDLEEILRQHEQWSGSARKSGIQANLSCAVLRWARNRPEMLRNVIEVARQANLKAGQRKKRLLLVR